MQSLTVDQNEQICQLVLAAGQQAYQAQKQRFEIFEKGADDYVTDVDRTLDRFLSQGLATLFPVDGIITEENSQSCQAFRWIYQRLWLIDPIDGTEEFIHQGNRYAVMVGVLEKADLSAGWVYAPARRRLYWGGPDWGLFYADQGKLPQVLTPSCPSPLTDTFCPVLLGYRDYARFGDAIAAYTLSLQCSVLGSFGLKVLEVIEGKAGLYLYLNRRVKLWDTVGPLALALAAGLVCCDLQGRPLVFDATGIDLDTLVHQQMIVVGWPDYVETVLPAVRRAVTRVMNAEPT